MVILYLLHQCSSVVIDPGAVVLSASTSWQLNWGWGLLSFTDTRLSILWLSPHKISTYLGFIKIILRGFVRDSTTTVLEMSISIVIKQHNLPNKCVSICQIDICTLINEQENLHVHYAMTRFNMFTCWCWCLYDFLWFNEASNISCVQHIQQSTYATNTAKYSEYEYWGNLRVSN